MSLSRQKTKVADSDERAELTGRGLGESIDFMNQENHIFLNKLTYICKNYDTSFKDVSRLRFSRLLELPCVLHLGNTDRSLNRSCAFRRIGEKNKRSS